MKKITFLLLFHFLVFLFAYPQDSETNKPGQKQKKLALVIGNANYEYGPNLRNPGNDADSIQNTLFKLGYKIDKQSNLGKSGLEKAIANFCLHLTNGDVGLFYYAGHGVQVDSYNYIIPVDSKLETEDDVKNNV